MTPASATTHGIRDALEWLERRRKAQRFSGLKAPIYLPDYRPQDFVGRSTYLERLRNALTWEPATFLLHGEPGTGKSMLALKFAWEAQKDFDAVIFQTCGQRPLDAITAELADRLPIDVKTRPPEEQRAAAKEWLRERQSLLVLDDVWSAEVRQLEPGPACSVLYTSRLKSLPESPPSSANRWKALLSRKRRRYFTAISIRISAPPKSRNIARRCWALRGESRCCRSRWLWAQVCCGRNRPVHWCERCPNCGSML